MARFRSKGTAGKVSGATNEVGALDDKIERLKPNPDAPVQNLEHRFMDRSSPLTARIIDMTLISKSQLPKQVIALSFAGTVGPKIDDSR